VDGYIDKQTTNYNGCLLQ